MEGNDQRHSLVRRGLDACVIGAVRLGVLLRYPRLCRVYAGMEGEHRILNVAAPRTVNEKFLWRKLFDHDPRFVRLSDKIAAREWLAEQGIEADMAEILWSGTDARDIPDEVLSGGVVVKGAHGYAMNIFLKEPPKDRAAFDEEANAFMARDHGRVERQWGYYDVPRRLCVERLLPGATSDLKIYTFGPRVKRLVAIYDRFDDLTADLWRTGDDDVLTLSEGSSVIGETRAGRPLPPFIDDALDLARRIGAHFDHMRVDLMSDGERFWLGELTVYNLGGHFAGVAAEDKAILNRAWDLRRSWFLTTPQRGWRALYRAALARRLSERQPLTERHAERRSRA